ncbi:uncharacterized protein LOC129593019 [Paramacrobiotus metropolitanus]|uniref:uncharacterized protein LOC129593019 n=1 Tax=Paramacrobiotus metropolitanus TaxID=2943436 RepID=UPI002445D069|nr:uncharacterized protein LOC129593019 [Paramacrobiotus metropolitanus]
MYCGPHSLAAQLANIPTNKRKVTLQHAAASAFHLQASDRVLRNFCADEVTLPGETVEVEIMNEISMPENNDSASELVCTKNLGEPKMQPVRSRGYIFVVRAGGHIDMFSPIYKSESPSQVFLILISWMYQVLQTVPSCDWPKLFLAYDNMCNLERLKATLQKLSLPPPYDELWTKGMTKVIDGFHLGNHKGHKCHTKYNPDQIRAAYPNLLSANTQSCEQTFRWLGAFQHAMFKMTKYRQLFFLHRIVKRRNLYLEKLQPLFKASNCYKV